MLPSFILIVPQVLSKAVSVLEVSELQPIRSSCASETLHAHGLTLDVISSPPYLTYLASFEDGPIYDFARHLDIVLKYHRTYTEDPKAGMKADRAYLRERLHEVRAKQSIDDYDEDGIQKRVSKGLPLKGESTVDARKHEEHQAIGGMRSPLRSLGAVPGHKHIGRKVMDCIDTFLSQTQRSKTRLCHRWVLSQQT